MKKKLFLFLIMNILGTTGNINSLSDNQTEIVNLSSKPIDVFFISPGCQHSKDPKEIIARICAKKLHLEPQQSFKHKGAGFYIKVKTNDGTSYETKRYLLGDKHPFPKILFPQGPWHKLGS